VGRASRRTLSRNRVNRGTTGDVPVPTIGVRMEHRFQQRRQVSANNLLADPTISDRRIPAGRVPPDAFGMCTTIALYDSSTRWFGTHS